jgi:rhodanese-related sulfurtransferase
MTGPSFKRQVFGEFARIGGALASERRLELLDLLAQGPRHVEALAQETGMSVANVSQHLQVLRRARLVETEREGTKVRYRIAGERVVQLWLALETLATARLPEIERLTREHAIPEAGGPELPRDRLEQLIDRGEGLLIDVRPEDEYRYGHLPGAVSLPLDDLPQRVGELPRDRPIIAYCRGRFCQTADEAVALLRRQGFDAHRLEGGWPEWWAEGRPVAR